MSDSSHPPIMQTYARLPVTFEKGEGVYLWDTNQKQYLDAVAGIAVCSLGHARRDIAEAIADQAQTLIHTSNLYQIGLQNQLGEKLADLTELSNCFFCNSGAEANEAAIKIARRFGHLNDIDTPQIIVANGSFHGRTLATLSATGNKKIQDSFSPLVEGFIHVPYNDINAIKSAAEGRDDVVAILVEPVQGEGGIQIPDENYLENIRNLCDENNWLMMLDEIQTGCCRTGQWFAFQHSSIKPDVVTVAKALGNGMPIGACISGEKAQDIFAPGTHGTTFGGNPLACRAGLAVIDAMEKEQIIDNVNTISAYIKDAFTEKLKDNPAVKEIRVKGLMIGIELNKDCGELVKKALEDGLLINVTAGNVIRLLPPLIIDTTIADEIVQKVSDLIKSSNRV